MNTRPALGIDEGLMALRSTDAGSRNGQHEHRAHFHGVIVLCVTIPNFRRWQQCRKGGASLFSS